MHHRLWVTRAGHVGIPVKFVEMINERISFVFLVEQHFISVVYSHTYSYENVENKNTSAFTYCHDILNEVSRVFSGFFFLQFSFYQKFIYNLSRLRLAWLYTLYKRVITSEGIYA